MLIQLKPTISTAKDENNVWGYQTNYNLGHCYPKKFVGTVCSQGQGSGGGPIPVQMTNRITTHR